MKNNRTMKQALRPYRMVVRQIYHQIQTFDRIVVFRHVMPDFDALGTQMGLVAWLKDNFPAKEIRYVGDDHVTFTPRLYPPMEIIEDDYFATPFLAIVLDTGNRDRISDQRYQKAPVVIKIDHHPVVDSFGHINLEVFSMAATSEIITSLIHQFPRRHILTKAAASYLYSGIAGDSGRFMYSSTTPHTFATAASLVATGINLSKDVYQKMYLKSIEDLKVTAYVLNHFSVSPHGVAYYVLSNEIQTSLKITPERGKENVNLFSNIEGINVWCSISEDPKDNVWRISIRSKEKAINQVAAQYGGGGHAQASGAKIDTLDDLDKFIADLDALFA
ncbi:MAG TPA: bifunctional oligoribonuclease/PAP phosphatase NrnA [Firmicutes bacterium]|nr:bifunctional oligoribonuclease/PAP phosphatase NrnA [Bacillota bacterium]